MTQQELLDELNKMGFNLEGTDKDQYCRWDAESDKYLAELKCRRAHYGTQMIEYDKLDCVKFEAESKGKEFLYCVSTPKGIYIFNVSKLCAQEYDFKWHNRRLPSKTDFANSYHKDKKVGYIDINDSEFSQH